MKSYQILKLLDIYFYIKDIGIILFYKCSHVFLISILYFACFSLYAIESLGYLSTY